MKKRYLKLLALALPILVGTVACSNSQTSDLSSDSSALGSEGSGPTSVVEMTPPSPISPSTETGVEVPALPTPPIPPDAAMILAIAHNNYNDYLNSSLVNVDLVRKKWEERVDPVTPDKITQNIVYLNNFFSFVYDADPQARIALGLVKMNVQVARKSLEQNDFQKMNRSLIEATEINFILRERIAKAAQIYGVDLAQGPLPSSDKLQALINRFQGTVIPKIQSSPAYFKDSAYWSQVVSDSEDHLAKLYQSVAFVWNKKGEGTSEFVSFENFRRETTSLLIYAFNDEQEGGFGAVDGSLIGF